MEHQALNLPDPRRPEQVNMTNNPLYCPYHRYEGHVIEDYIAFKEWLQRAVNEKKVNLDPEAINPKYHTSNMITVGSCLESSQEGEEHGGSWVPLSQVEQQLSDIALASIRAPITRHEEHHPVRRNQPWRVVHRQTTSKGHPQQHQQSTTLNYTPSKTWKKSDPSKRRMPSRFVPWSEGDAPFPRPSREPVTLKQFLPPSWGQASYANEVKRKKKPAQPHHKILLRATSTLKLLVQARMSYLHVRNMRCFAQTPCQKTNKLKKSI